MTKLKTIKIKGREYVEVNERLKYFRKNYPNFTLTSEITHIDSEMVVVKASIIDPDWVTKATGHAHEEKSSSYINKTSYVENCETSAWGRALANFGIGIDSGVASADEVEIAIKKQSPDKKKMSAKVFEEMLKAIADGKGDLVKERMGNYIMTSAQERTINTQLS
tara:strand:- start:21309 stop:21803 length:495 start_codon:yes stop_codon:yes gene_type:complete